MPRLQDYRTRLASLSADAAPAELQRLADELAERCRSERYPRKSLAAALRHARQAVPEATIVALRELAERALGDSELAGVTPAPTIEPFIGLAEASRRLNVAAKTLADRLREARYRRLYGWPWWDGRQWWFSPGAIDPATRAAHLATLPFDEPAAHTAMLPDWCDGARPERSDEATVVRPVLADNQSVTADAT